MPWRPASEAASILREVTTLTEFTADASASLGGPRWLERRRAAAYERFAESPFPAESEEVWRYSGIDDFEIGVFSPPSPAAAAGLHSRDTVSDLAAAREIADRLGERCALVVTRDGVARAVDAPDPVVLEEALDIRFAHEASGDGEEPPGLGALARPHDAFGELHEAFLADVVVVTVSPKVTISKPVVVIHLVSRAKLSGDAAARKAKSCFPRTLVRVGRSGEAGLIEVLAGTGRAGLAGGALVVPVTELDIAEDAHLSYANLQLLDRGCSQIALQASRVDHSGLLRSFTAGLGSSYARVRTDSDLAGQGAESSLLAAYLGTDDQIHDFRTLQNHHSPRTRSELLFKGAVADRARSVYSGLIRIERGARGSDAFQTNHNLVLSEGAHADSVPNLDIDENDVRCSHASTVGPIDEDQRYYLESRGIAPTVAERLIVLGFFSELASRAPFAGIGSLLESTVADRLGGRLPSDRPDDRSVGAGGGDA